jgi:predicted FMN-binding regulatory protein PaiB
MTDIVERLRDRADNYLESRGNEPHYFGFDAALDREAADEIERLRVQIFHMENSFKLTRNDALEEAAKVADEWEPLERLLPLANDEMNEAAHTGQYEAGERIAANIRALKERKE